MKRYKYENHEKIQIRKSRSHVVISQTTSKKCTKKRAARVARLFSFGEPNDIIDLICCVLIAVKIVAS